MLLEIWSFLKKPLYIEDENTDLSYRVLILFKLLIISITLSIVLGMLIGALEFFFGINLGKHAIDDFFENYPLYYLFIGAVILAPLIEELIFRGPMVLFKSKPYFPIAFYLLTLIFGFYHITNFEITPTILLFSPILVAPQLAVGGILGYIRVRFGLVWSVIFHASYNLILIGPVILMKLLNIPLE